jgi:hypothetical protein
MIMAKYIKYKALGTNYFSKSVTSMDYVNMTNYNRQYLHEYLECKKQY